MENNYWTVVRILRFVMGGIEKIMG